jgi:hypothetical protein
VAKTTVLPPVPPLLVCELPLIPFTVMVVGPVLFGVPSPVGILGLISSMPVSAIVDIDISDSFRFVGFSQFVIGHRPILILKTIEVMCCLYMILSLLHYALHLLQI